MARVDQDGEMAVSADLQAALVEQQLQVIEHPRGPKRPLLPWLMGLAGLLVVVGLGIHGYFAYTTITRINVNAKIGTANPIIMFQDIATNGPRVGSSVETSSRATYTKALEQFLLDGTGMALGIVLLVSGVFVRSNL